MSSPSPVLYAHSANELYGSDIVLLELVRRLDPARYRPLVVTPTDISYEGLLSQALAEATIDHEALDIPVLRRRYFSPTGIPGFLRRMRKGTSLLQQRIEEHGIALVHSNTSAVWGGGLAARRTQTPHLWHVHEIVTEPTLVKSLMAWMIARYSDHVVAISRAVADHLLGDQPTLEPRLSVIYDAVDTDLFSPDIGGETLRNDWGIHPDAVLVGVVGRISAWKGQDLFLKAFALALAKAPQLRAVIVGNPPPHEEWRLQELKSRAEELGIDKNVIWAGFRQDTPRVMAAIDMLALPSTQPEPFGMVILEAMAAGKPVIATAHGGPLETVSAGETGYLISPTDPADMARAMQNLATNAYRRRQFGKQARKRAIQEFSFTRQIDAFSALYEKMIVK